MLTPFAILPWILVFKTVSISHVIDYAHSDCFSHNVLTSWLTIGKLKRKFRVNDNLAATLGDSLVDYSTLLNTVGTKQLILWIHMVNALITPVLSYADWSIDSGKFTKLLYVSAHLLVTDYRQSLVILERDVSILLQYGTAVFIQFDCKLSAVLTVVTSIWSSLISLLRRFSTSEYRRPV